MEKNNTTIHTNVMRRVHTIHAARPLLSGTMLAAMFSLGSLYLIGRKVWVAKVFANMPNPAHVLSFSRFFEYAFLNTTAVVQALCIATIFGFVWLAREIMRELPALRFA